MKIFMCILVFIFLVNPNQASEMEDFILFHSNFMQGCKKIEERFSNMKNVYQENPNKVKFYTGESHANWSNLIKLFKEITIINDSNYVQSKSLFKLFEKSDLKNQNHVVSRMAFGVYCSYMPFVKKIENILFVTDKKSFLFKELQNIKINIINYSKFFNYTDENISNFLKITPQGNVYLNFYDIRTHMKRKAKNLLSVINKINLNELDLNKKYKKYLKDRFSLYKNFYTKDLEIKMIMSREVRSLMNQDLSKDSRFPPVNILNNFRLLEEAEQVVFCPLDLTIFPISNEEKEREKPKLLAMLNNTYNARLKHGHTSKGLENTPISSLNNFLEDSISVLSSKVEEENLNPLIYPNTSSQIIEITNDSISPSNLQKDEKDIPEQNEEDDESDYLYKLKELKITTLTWVESLELMAQESKIQGINSQLYKISTLMIKVDNLSNLYLMEQLAEATNQTALRISMMETHKKQVNLVLSTRKKERLNDFLYSPLASLKDKIRIKKFYSLLKALGGDYNEGREGSRVALSINGHETSIHKPHGKYGPYLDSGRITSLRRFLIGSGLNLSALLD